MKKSIAKTVYSLILLGIFNCMALLTVAQEQSTGQTTTTTKTTSYHFYTEPWAWVVGGIVVLILLVVLFRGRDSGKSETRTTIIR